MSSRNNVLAVIPARGGSKGIKGKNLARIGGKPLIAWTIEAALRAKAVGRVIVSTDSPEIARAARRWGAETPFLRPRSLARDATPMIDVLRHALEQAPAEWLLLLQPTSPLRGSARIEQAVRLARRADTVVGVCKPAVHPWKCVLFDGGKMSFAVPRPRRQVNRQDYPEVYAINGALYLTRGELVRRGKLYGKRVAPLVMEAWESVDIDQPADLRLAEHYLKEASRA